MPVSSRRGSRVLTALLLAITLLALVPGPTSAQLAVADSEPRLGDPEASAVSDVAATKRIPYAAAGDYLTPEEIVLAQFSDECSELADMAPEVSGDFDQAIIAWQVNGNLQRACDLLESVMGAAPRFTPAIYTLSYLETGQGHPKRAVDLAQRALDISEGPEENAVLAWALLSSEDRSVLGRAIRHARRSVELDPEYVFGHFVRMNVAIEFGSEKEGASSAREFAAFSPGSPEAYYYLGLADAIDGRWVEARRNLERAKELGFSPEAIDELLATGIGWRAALYEFGRFAAVATAIWIAVSLALLVVGGVLSASAMRTVARAQRTGVLATSALERLVRFVYRFVIWIASAYFYVSVPFLVVIVLMAACALVYGILMLGFIPIYLLAMIVVGALSTVLAVVMSLRRCRLKDDPGQPLGRDEAPALWQLTQRVAGKLGEPEFDAIYATPGVEIGVAERGGTLARLRGAGERALFLGLGAVNGLTIGQLESIVAHEFGHLTNRDGAGGNLALQVRVAAHRLAYDLAQTGQAAWFNPAWIFVNAFHRFFLRITHGASRLQEFLADRFSVRVAGAEGAADGLAAVVRQSVRFNAQVRLETEAAEREKRMVADIYALPEPETTSSEFDLDVAVEAELNRATSPYDSHPSPAERIEVMRRIGGDTVRSEDADRSAATLFTDLDALRGTMMEQVRGNFTARHQAPDYIPETRTTHPERTEHLETRTTHSERTEHLSPSMKASCTACKHGEPRTGRESWCRLERKTVMWNATCNDFEAGGPEGDLRSD